MDQIIVSVHMPKVAGTSFLNQLRTLYGEQSLFLDYRDDPTNPLSVRNIDPHFYDIDPIKTIAPYRAVHGHFHPGKYDKLDGAFRLTFLRHPVDNIVSIYEFWRAHEKGFWAHPVFSYFKESNLPITRLAMIPQLRYLYSCSYFGGFNMDRFDFIGDYSQYDQELARLGTRLGVSFDLGVRHNVTANLSRMSSRLPGRQKAISDNDYAELAGILKDDIEFYEKYRRR